MRRWRCKATLLKDDPRTGWRAGRVLDPKGFYRQGKNVVLVGSVSEDHTMRVTLPLDAVDIELEDEDALAKSSSRPGGC